MSYWKGVFSLQIYITAMTLSEENYLKTIYHLSTAGVGVSTNAIAARMETKASSVTDMIRKLSGKQLVTYVKYKGVELTPKGRLAATMVVRKHRLWEVFLVDKLGFTWGEVHDVAEELEHIKSEKLINKLDEFLGYPKSDPHGDPIPDAQGNIHAVNKLLLSACAVGETGICVGVKDSSSEFLSYLDKNGIALGVTIKVLEKEVFDGSLTILVGQKELKVSDKMAGNVYVKKT